MLATYNIVFIYSVFSVWYRCFYSLFFFETYNDIIYFLNTWMGNFLLCASILLFFGYSISKYCILLIFKLKKYSIFLKVIKLNINLWVGCVTTHPPLLYIAWIYLGINYLNSQKYRYTFISVKLNTNIIIVALSLGSLWGFNNGVWGFY